MTKTTGRPRLRKSELFRVIGYQPHGVQVAVHRSPAKLRVLACGARFGKSTCASAEVVAALLQPCEQSLGWVIGPNLEVTNRILDRVRLVLHKHFSSRVELDRAREHRIVVRNLGGGLSEVRGKSADARPSLLGAELDWLVMDECAKVKRAVWEEHLSARLIDRNGWALLVGTPGAADWFWELFVRGRAGDDAQCRAWRAPTWDNPHVSRSVIEQERARLPAPIFEQQFGARFQKEAPERCTCCGFPSPDPLTWMFVYIPERFVYCRVCRNLVDRSGRTLVRWRDDGTLGTFALATGMPCEDEVLEEQAEAAAAACVPRAM